MANRKYEMLEDDTITLKGAKLYRIKAIKSFSDIKEGDLGGYIASEKCLWDFGDCWVTDNAAVGGKSTIGDSAVAGGNAVVWDSHVADITYIGDDATVIGTEMFGNSSITGSSYVQHSNLQESIKVSGDAVIINSGIEGNINISGNVQIKDSSIRGKGEFSGNLKIDDWLKKVRDIKMSGDARITRDGLNAEGSFKVSGRYERLPE